MRRALRVIIIAVGLVLALAPAYSAQAAPRAAVGGGSAIIIDGRSACTMTTVGHDRTGRLVGLTAGHCGNIGSSITLERNRQAGLIGRVVAKNAAADYAVIALDPAKVAPQRTAGGSTIRSVGTFPGPGATVCKSGRTTGHTCGPVLDLSNSDSLSYVCAAPGDSGGPIVAGDRLVGMLNGGLIIDIPGTNAGISVECVHPAIPIFTPMVATKFTSIIAELNRIGGPGAGFRPI